MHVPSAVPSPPRRGRKIPSGRGQVANIRQGKERNKCILTWSTMRLVCFLCLIQEPVVVGGQHRLASKKEEGPRAMGQGTSLGQPLTVDGGKLLWFSDEIGFRCPSIVQYRVNHSSSQIKAIMRFVLFCSFAWNVCSYSQLLSAKTVFFACLLNGCPSSFVTSIIIAMSKLNQLVRQPHSQDSLFHRNNVSGLLVKIYTIW